MLVWFLSLDQIRLKLIFVLLYISYFMSAYFFGLRSASISSSAIHQPSKISCSYYHRSSRVCQWIRRRLNCPFLINNLKRLKYELILIITIYIIQMSTTTVQPFDGKAAAADAPKQNVDMKDVRIDIS